MDVVQRKALRGTQPLHPAQPRSPCRIRQRLRMASKQFLRPAPREERPHGIGEIGRVTSRERMGRAPAPGSRERAQRRCQAPRCQRQLQRALVTLDRTIGIVPVKELVTAITGKRHRHVLPSQVADQPGRNER